MDAREYSRNYMRETRRWLVDRGYCSECGNRDAFTMAGRWRCAECAERHNSQPRDRKAENERAKEQRKYRRENRLCTKCGTPLPNLYSYVMCKNCRAHDRNIQEVRRRDRGIMPKSLYRELGLCVKCGAPRMNGLTLWGGEEIQLCERCYANTVKNSKAGRDSFLENHGTTWGNYQYEYEHLIRHGQKRENP